MAYLWQLEIKDGTKISTEEYPRPKYRKWFHYDGVWRNEDGDICEVNANCCTYYIYEEPEKVKRYWKWVIMDSDGIKESCFYLDENLKDSSGFCHEDIEDDVTYRRIRDSWVELNQKGELVNWSGKEE